MKNIFLLSTKLRVYLTEIPPVILLGVIFRFNNLVDGVFKLYPLMVATMALIIFIPIYFTGGVVLNYDEIKCVGVFPPHDRAYMGDDKTLVLTCLPKKRMRFELFEKSGSEEVFSWTELDPDTEINIFRAKARGTEKTAVKLLCYYGVEKELAASILDTETPKTDLGDITVRSEFAEEGKKIFIHFNIDLLLGSGKELKPEE